MGKSFVEIAFGVPITIHHTPENEPLVVIDLNDDQSPLWVLGEPDLDRSAKLRLDEVDHGRIILDVTPLVNCHPCHKAETAALAARWAQARRDAKAEEAGLFAGGEP